MLISCLKLYQFNNYNYSSPSQMLMKTIAVQITFVSFVHSWFMAVTHVRLAKKDVEVFSQIYVNIMHIKHDPTRTGIKKNWHEQVAATRKLTKMCSTKSKRKTTWKFSILDVIFPWRGISSFSFHMYVLVLKSIPTYKTMYVFSKMPFPSKFLILNLKLKASLASQNLPC